MATIHILASSLDGLVDGSFGWSLGRTNRHLPLFPRQDYIPNLVAMTKTNLESDDETLLSSGRVSLVVSLSRGKRRGRLAKARIDTKKRER